MIYMIEINNEHIPQLYELFGENANILNGDFLDSTNQKYDIIIGNPPFNRHGLIKTPTSTLDKRLDGKAIWRDFVINSINNLNNNGTLLMITPSFKSTMPMPRATLKAKSRSRKLRFH